jgi:hypothetical protein
MPRRTPLRLRRKTTQSGKKGPPKRNLNALKSGAFADLGRRNLDQRTKLAKALRAVEGELVAALGGDPTPQEQILIQRVGYKLARITLFEAATLTGESPSDHVDKVYLAWSNSLRLDLQALGLERRQKDVTELTAYMREAYSEKE